MDEAKRPSTSTGSSGSVVIRPHLVYGLRPDVIGNVQFNLTREVIYPVEGVLAFHDYVNNRQRFLRLPEETRPEIIAISTHRKLLAVLEINVKSGRYIAIYELGTLKKRCQLELPHHHKHGSFQQMIFSYDSRCVSLLTHSPDEVVVMIYLDQNNATVEGRATALSSRGSAEFIAAHPNENTILAVGGRRNLMILTKSERGFTVTKNIKLRYRVTSLAFLGVDLLIAGTDEDSLILVEKGVKKLMLRASKADAVDLSVDQAKINRQQEADDNLELGQERDVLLNTSVKCMTSFPRGFAYIIFNKVFVFERMSKSKFERKTVITVPIGIYAESTYQIQNLAIDHKEETIIVTTQHAQIYVGILIVPETLKTKHLEFKPLGVLIHNGEVIDVSVCAWKPIIMTASKDQTVRIWNYETSKVELVRKFQVDVHIVELNTNGQMAAVGFSDQLRITQIFMDDLNIIKTYNFPHCNEVRYSNLGHLMAAAYSNKVAVTAVYTLGIRFHLDGHKGTVTSVAWSKDDNYLVSCCSAGAIYQWDAETGAVLQHFEDLGMDYQSIQCSTSSDALKIYVGTQNSTLREFQGNKLVRDIVVPSRSKGRISDICLSRSDLMLFVADHEGNLFNMQMPFDGNDCGISTNFRFYEKKVNKLRFSYDGTLLMAISQNGTVAIWVLDNTEDKLPPIDADLLKSQEVLIPRTNLSDKNQHIFGLEQNLKQQADQFQYTLAQNEISDGQQQAEVHRSYCAALQELRDLNTEIEETHDEELNFVENHIDEINTRNHDELEKVANQYSERMLFEYKKFTKLRDSMMEMREQYEEQLKACAETMKDTVVELEDNYSQQLEDRKNMLRKLLRQMDDRKDEFIAYCHVAGEQNDRKMVDTLTIYERKMTRERNEYQGWRNKSDKTQRLYEVQSKDIENLLAEVEELKLSHYSNKRCLQKQLRTIEDLKQEISDRDAAINAKEKRIQDLLHKNIELEKYKLVLTHKITELKAEIEPREFTIKDKRKHIREMIKELEGLSQNNMQLDLQLKEMRDKYHSNLIELKTERRRSRAARDCIKHTCEDIHYTAADINDGENLKKAVIKLYHKHSNDDQIKHFAAQDPMERDVYVRQRKKVESVLNRNKKVTVDKTLNKKMSKLVKDNDVLKDELCQQEEEKITLQTRIKDYSTNVRFKTII